MVRTLDLRSIGREFDGLSAIECNAGQVVNTHVPLSPSSIIWYLYCACWRIDTDLCASGCMHGIECRTDL